MTDLDSRRPVQRSRPPLAALLLALLAFSPLLVIVWTRVTPVPQITPTTPVTVLPPTAAPSLDTRRPVQLLYALEADAAATGWTFDAHLLAGNLWRDIGDLDRAVSHYQAAARLDPADASLTRALALTYIDLARWTDAARTLEALLVQQPDDPWAALNLALITAPFNPSRAVDYLVIASRDPGYRTTTAPLLDVLQTDPADPFISYRVGGALAALEQWRFAELAFTQAADVNAPFPEALAYAGFARDNQGKSGSTQVEQALALAPDSAQVQYLAGLHFRRTGDENASLAALAQAVVLAPDNPAYNAELGEAYRLAGDLRSADHWLRMAVLVSDNDPQFQNLLDRFHAEQVDSLPDLFAPP